MGCWNIMNWNIVLSKETDSLLPHPQATRPDFFSCYYWALKASCPELGRHALSSDSNVHSNVHVHSFCVCGCVCKTCLHCIFQMYFNFFCGVPDILCSGLCTNSMDPFHCRLYDHALWWVLFTRDRQLLATLKLYMTMTFYCLWLPSFLSSRVKIG